uniref:EGF-like domain-containing protein n=1 Tax=Amphimedon queenslandica TaxID=400682 RepID=A0A1X7SU66_AMPQE
HEDKKLYLCPRKVSTVLCVHDVANDTDSSTNDDGGGGSTPCVSPWCGEKCELLNCDETDCNGNGVCTNGSCKCKAGWYGSLCEKFCPHNRYGPGCEYSCYCNDNGACHHVTGSCICNTGYTGPHCMERI